jgi:hypothetical protein
LTIFQALTLAGDALRLAATALRLSLLPSGSSNAHADKKLREISLDEVSKHDHADDCWIVVNDMVYDVTNFLNSVRTHFASKWPRNKE